MKYRPFGFALIALTLACGASAQTIKLSLKDSTKALLTLDSSNWNEAWIEVDGTKPNASTITKEDFRVSDGSRTAQVLSVDSIPLRSKSYLALSFVLDNSGSMFHSYDSLTRYCDSIADSLPAGCIAQAVTFDNRFRSESHLYTKRSSIFIAEFAFTDSLNRLRKFWHYYDTIRTQYTPLYDAIAAAVQNIDERRLHSDTLWNDVVIVVTDGEDNASRASIEDVRDLISNNRLRLFAINYRTEEDARLEWLARQSGGAYFLADDLKDLRVILGEIRHSLARQYHIRYLFPSSGPISPH